MIERSRLRPAPGWTLLEMAVVLVIAALLAVVVLPLLPLGAKMGEQELAEQRLSQAQDALVGYSLSHFRLPYADQDGDGREDIGALAGRLPGSTLGLADNAPMGYAVKGELAAAADPMLYNPDLPVVAGVATTPLANGLDFCVRLAATLNNNGLHVGGTVASAFALSHRLADGGGQAVPISISSAYNGPAAGDASLLTNGLGMGELYARMGCIERLPRAYAAAQSAQTAQSEYLLADLHKTTRDFYQEIADLDRDNAQIAVDFAAFDLALGLIQVAMSAVMAVPDLVPPEDAFKVAVAIAQGIIAAAQIGTTVYALVQAAAQAKEDAGTGYQAALNSKAAAAAQLARITELRNAAALKARQLDATGLNP